MKNGLHAATIPFDGYARPTLFGEVPLFAGYVLPANAVADIEIGRRSFIEHRLFRPRPHLRVSREIARFGRRGFKVPTLIASPVAKMLRAKAFA